MAAGPPPQALDSLPSRALEGSPDNRLLLADFRCGGLGFRALGSYFGSVEEGLGFGDLGLESFRVRALQL